MGAGHPIASADDRPPSPDGREHESISPMGFLNEILERPENEKPCLLLLVGHPAADAHVPDIARRPPDEVTEFRE